MAKFMRPLAVGLCLRGASWVFLFQDKYLADMDELFSQVDEKRKVSVPQLPALPSPNCLP